MVGSYRSLLKLFESKQVKTTPGRCYYLCRKKTPSWLNLFDVKMSFTYNDISILKKFIFWFWYVQGPEHTMVYSRGNSKLTKIKHVYKIL